MPEIVGKGPAIRTAIDAARGAFSLIQDADLEYDPAEYGRLLKPLLEGRADVVFGSRFLVAEERRVLYFWHALANHALTTLANIVSNLNLTDMETCYKAFRTPLLQSIPITSDRFGIEPELTIKMAQRQARIYEVPIRKCPSVITGEPTRKERRSVSGTRSRRCSLFSGLGSSGISTNTPEGRPWKR